MVVVIGQPSGQSVLGKGRRSECLDGYVKESKVLIWEEEAVLLEFT